MQSKSDMKWESSALLKIKQKQNSANPHPQKEKYITVGKVREGGNGKSWWRMAIPTASEFFGCNICGCILQKNELSQEKKIIRN